MLIKPFKFSNSPSESIRTQIGAQHSDSYHDMEQQSIMDVERRRQRLHKILASEHEQRKDGSRPFRGYSRLKV